MIEKVASLTFTEPAALRSKINELIEASNRQDKVIAWLLAKNSHYRSEIAQDIGEADEFYYREINRG